MTKFSIEMSNTDLKHHFIQLRLNEKSRHINMHVWCRHTEILCKLNAGIHYCIIIIINKQVKFTARNIFINVSHGII